MEPLITVDELRKLMPLLSLAKAGAFAPLLEAAMWEQGITSKSRRCAFLANLAHESVQLTVWIENLKYTAARLLVIFPNHFASMSVASQYAHRGAEAIANRVYANRLGNGDEQTRDGWKYRGRGPIGLTGRKNYRLYGDLLGVGLERDPDQAASPEYGFRIAACFWRTSGCNDLTDKLQMDGSIAEANQFARITKRINGGLNGLADRMNYYRIAKQVLHADTVAAFSPSIEQQNRAIVPTESVARQSESPAEVSPDTDVDLLGVAVNSSTLSKASAHVGPRIAKHSSAALSFALSLYEAHKIATILVVVVLLAGAGWVVYHNRKYLKPLLLKLTK